LVLADPHECVVSQFQLENLAAKADQSHGAIVSFDLYEIAAHSPFRGTSVIHFTGSPAASTIAAFGKNSSLFLNFRGGTRGLGAERISKSATPRSGENINKAG
jgi:hypothetical protein